MGARARRLLRYDMTCAVVIIRIPRPSPVFSTTPRRRAGTAASPLWVRGPVGELPIHMCYIVQQFECADAMVEHDPRLLRAAYTGQEYTGENLLHIAIV